LRGKRATIIHSRIGEVAKRIARTTPKLVCAAPDSDTPAKADARSSMSNICPGQPQASELARVVRERQHTIVGAWLADLNAGRWLDSLPSTLASEFQDRHLPTLLALIEAYIDEPSAAIEAVYRDEVQRFDLQVGDALEPGFTTEQFLDAQREAFAQALGASGPMSAAAQTWLDALNQPIVRPASSQVEILLVGDCLMNEIRCFLAQIGREHDVAIRGQHAYLSAALNAQLDLRQIGALLEHRSIDLIGLSPFTFDALPVYRDLLFGAGDLGGTEEIVSASLSIVGGMIDELRSVSDAPILLHNACGAPTGDDRLRLTTLPPLTDDGRRAIDALNRGIAERAPTWDRVILLDEEAAAERCGLDWLSEPAFERAGLADALFHTSRLGQTLARSYWDAVVSCMMLGRLRLLAVDFDNTLWSGVVAEGPVVHHHDRQQILLDLARQGVLLVGLSTGSAETVRWDESLLTPADFLEVQRNWRPKVENLREVLLGANIRPEHVAVIDDDPAQLSVLAVAIPELATLDARAPDVWSRLDLLRHLYGGRPTAEARHRLTRYRADRQRRQLAAAQPTFAELMATLELTLEVRRMVADDLARVHELLHRTNQFNTTGVTMSLPAIDQRLESDDHLTFVADLRDRFGDFGMVAVAMVNRIKEPTIEAFAMSCRALGYGVEQAILAAVIADVGIPVVGHVVPTRLNEPCHLVYATAGFSEREPGLWALDVGSGPPAPPWVHVRPYSAEPGQQRS
jgi:FkbH-like protein